MAMADYYLCDVCGRKAFYDSEVEYGECRVAALCEDCSNTHKIVIVERHPKTAQADEPASLHAEPKA